MQSSKLSTNPHNSDPTANNAHIAESLDPERIEVRNVREDEIHCVADIITRSFHFDRGWLGWFTPLFKLGIAEDLRHRLRAHPTSYYGTTVKPHQQVCSIATYTELGKSQVVGTIEVGVRNANYRQSPHHRYVYISNLAVSRDFRRRGVAQKLLLDCEELTKSWGFTELHLHVMGDNERGRNLYQKLGYEVISKELVWSLLPWHRPERIFLCKQLS